MTQTPQPQGAHLEGGNTGHTTGNHPRKDTTELCDEESIEQTTRSSTRENCQAWPADKQAEGCQVRPTLTDSQAPRQHRGYNHVSAHQRKKARQMQAACTPYKTVITAWATHGQQLCKSPPEQEGRVTAGGLCTIKDSINSMVYNCARTHHNEKAGQRQQACTSVKTGRTPQETPTDG